MVIVDFLITDWHLTMFDALHRTSLTLALAALPAARERRGMEGDGEDFADRAGSRALRARREGGAR